MNPDFKDKNKEILSLDKLYTIENLKDSNKDQSLPEYSFKGYIGDIIPRAYFTHILNSLGDCLLNREETSLLVKSIGIVKINGKLIDRFYDDCTVVLSQTSPKCTD
jgi:hypothetical protein